MTEGERLLVSSVFGDAIDLACVTLNHRRYMPFQLRRYTMAPNGHIWFHPQSLAWSRDFSREPLGRRAFFLHEMTHVWQHQQGINLLFRRYPFARYRYLPLTPGKPFHAYGIEQQAEIVRDYYVLSQGGHMQGAPPLPVYRALIPFLPAAQLLA